MHKFVSKPIVTAQIGAVAGCVQYSLARKVVINGTVRRGLVVTLLLILGLALILVFAPPRTVAYCPPSERCVPLPKVVHIWEPAWWTGQ
jgi:hypothetical protein